MGSRLSESPFKGVFLVVLTTSIYILLTKFRHDHPYLEGYSARKVVYFNWVLWSHSLKQNQLLIRKERKRVIAVFNR